MRPGSSFVPRRTTRLIPGEDRDDIDVLVIARALTPDKKDILGIQARFGGKAYDVTWLSATAAARAASTGLDIGGRHFDLRLLGRRALDVSVFVACEYPDEYLIELLKQYGTFDESKIRHLHLKEPGFQHIENGIRVIQFTELHRDLPSTLVYRNTPMGFRYTGQPKVCFKCASPDHMVRDCPQKLNPIPEPTPETENTGEQTADSDTESESSTTSDMETGQTSIQDTPVKQLRPKRPRLETPINSDNEQSTTPPTPASQQNTAPAQLPENTDTQPTETLTPPTSATPSTSLPSTPATSETASQDATVEQTQELFAATPTPSPPTPQQQMDKLSSPRSGPRMKKFMEAISTQGPARQALMRLLKPAGHYYKARGFYLQHKYGDCTDTQRHTKNAKETVEWRKQKGVIRQDAFAALLHLYGELSENFDLPLA